MAKIKKTLKWMAIVLAVLPLGVPLLLAAINAFDEDLKPEAIAFADLSDDDVPPETNGFYAWVGLTVPIGEAPHARGVQIVAQVNEKLDTVLWEFPDTDAFLGPKRLQLTTGPTELCGRDTTGCLDRYRTKVSEIDKWVRENKVLLERYRALYVHPNFRDTIKPRVFAPILADPIRVAGLARAQHAVRALRGDAPGALHRLRDDTAYWRRVLAESRASINRMIATSMIKINVQLISEIVASLSTDKNARALAADAARPLTEQERDLAKVFRHEFSLGQHFLTTLPAAHKAKCGEEQPFADCAVDILANTFLLKPNATINQSFEHFEKRVALSKLPGPQYLRQAREKRLFAQNPDWPWSWHFVYNPMGKILYADADSVYLSYITRIHNLDGFLRLVSLQLAIKQSAIRDADVPTFLERAEPMLRNPYTNEPMLWDAERHAIYFDGIGERLGESLLDKRVEVRL